MGKRIVYKINGRQVSRKEFRRHRRQRLKGLGPGEGPMISGAWRRPLHSHALGCHSSQVEEFRERARKAGLTGVDFTPDGVAVLSTRQQRKEYARLRGAHDMDGGYGDG